MSSIQVENANTEMVAKTTNAIDEQIVIKCPTSALTGVVTFAAVGGGILSVLPATWSTTAAPTASTNVMIARSGQLRDFPDATAQRYRQARWPRVGPQPIRQLRTIENAARASGRGEPAQLHRHFCRSRSVEEEQGLLHATRARGGHLYRSRARQRHAHRACLLGP